MNRSYFRLSTFATLLMTLAGCAGSPPPHNPSSNMDGNYPHNAYTNPNVPGANYRGHGYYDEYQHYDPLEPLK